MAMEEFLERALNNITRQGSGSTGTGTGTGKGTGTGIEHESALSVFRMFISSQRAELTMQWPQTKTKCTAHVREG